MTDAEIIIAVAKLDGRCEPNVCKPSIEQLEAILADKSSRVVVSLEPSGQVRAFPDYLNSRDAIIPVIEKLWKDSGDTGFDGNVFVDELQSAVDRPICCNTHTVLRCLKSAPRQLCIATLKAAGEWKE